MQTLSHVEGGPRPASSQKPAAINSLLVADCGTVMTKVSLFGLVEGQYRLMARGEAPTTARPPHEDITEGIIQAVQVVEFITGRRLIDEKQILSPEQENGDGVDLFISTVSAGDPLRLAVMGAVSPALEGLVAQAISGLYAQEQALPAPSYVAATTPASVAVGAGPVSGPAAPWTPERTAQEWQRQLARLQE